MSQEPRSLRFYRDVGGNRYTLYLTVSERTYGESGLHISYIIDAIGDVTLQKPKLEDKYLPMGFDKLKEIVKNAGGKIMSEHKQSAYVAFEPEQVVAELNKFLL